MDLPSTTTTVSEFIQAAARAFNILLKYCVANTAVTQRSHKQITDDVELILDAAKVVDGIAKKHPSSLGIRAQQAILDEWSKTDGSPAQCKKALDELLSWLEGLVPPENPRKFVLVAGEKMVTATLYAFDPHMRYFRNIVPTHRLNPAYNPITAEQRDSLMEVLKWFDGVDCTVKHENTLTQRQEATGEWLFDEKLYIDWRSSTTEFLWLNGKPGAGKSVLASVVIDHLSRNLKQDETLAYFYCDFRNFRCTSAMEVLRSLIAQLFRQAKANWLPSFSELEDRKGRGAGPPTDVNILSGLLRRAANLHSRPIIVIDALDECDDLPKLLHALVGLNDGHCRFFVTSRTAISINEAFTGLPTISLSDKAKAVHDDMKSHIETELESRDRLKKLKNDLKEKIRVRLMEKADGMFRWVQCQLDRLNDCWSPGDINEVLDTLPTTLYETYERILSTIDRKEFDSRIARRALMWLVSALEPLRLSSLAQALTINSATLKWDPDIAPMCATDILVICRSLVIYDEEREIVSLSHYSVKEYLTSALAADSKYFVELPSASLELASVSIQSLILLGHQPDDVDPHMIAYTLFSGLRHLADCAPTENESLLRLLFALQDQIPNIRRQSKAVLQALWSWRHEDWYYLTEFTQPALYIIIRFGHLSLVQHYLDHHPVHATETDNPLVYAVYSGDIPRVRMLLDAGLDINLHGEFCFFRRWIRVLPLIAALKIPGVKHREELIRFLLARGSRIPEDIIHTALRRRSGELCPPSVIRVLLDYGADARSLADNGDNPLHSLVCEHRTPHTDILEILHLLVEAGCDPTASGSGGLSFLQLAIRMGHESVVRWLVESSVQLPPFPILDAVRNPDVTLTMLHLLIEQGVDVDVSDHEGNSALHVFLCGNAMEYHDTEVMRLLVDRGCKIDSKNNAGETPMHVAAQRGDSSAVDFLVDEGASIPEDIVNYTAKGAHENPQVLVDLVLKHGASVHGHNTDDGTPLHSLLRSYTFYGNIDSDMKDSLREAVQVLLDNGCNIHAVDLSGDTPLHIAARNGLASIVRYLLDRGAQPGANIIWAVAQNVHSSLREISRMLLLRVTHSSNKLFLRDTKGNSLLHVLCEQLRNGHHFTNKPDDGFVERVQLLQEAGYDLDGCANATNNQGDTPLQIALQHSQTTICPQTISYLVGIGAKFSRVKYLFLDNFAWASHLPWYPDIVEACRDALARPRTTSRDVLHVYRLLLRQRLPPAVIKVIMNMAEYWVVKSIVHNDLALINQENSKPISLPAVTEDVRGWTPRRLVFSCKPRGSEYSIVVALDANEHRLLEGRSLSDWAYLRIKHEGALYSLPCRLRVENSPGIPAKTTYAIWDDRLARDESWGKEIAVKDLTADDMVLVNIFQTSSGVALDFVQIDMYWD
ncbi:hypothetical protein HYDPIDRAFT_29421 [Hydnomerulius pinastri MD-312]|uniref:Nephrocystin 3-like N-terminal domain-containing protein n=1 Tax=Hydnomerulius pinastri MD-312 TaxID=994086 RepID=A0A0C9VZ15_9AGAM|nr:hypothetical protein HYDPIDRAFT_29421 [Hydnomerulius pinastri MD-312]